MATKIKKLGLKRRSGYLLFIDKQGDVSEAKMNRGGKKKKALSGVKKLKPAKKVAKRKTAKRKTAKRKK